MSRLEHAPAGGKPSRYAKIDHDPEKFQDVLAESFIESWQGLPPSRLVLDIDSTDDAVHGRQEGRSFGYYNHYCFLPLYITCGGRPLFALLRQEWPWLKILLRADSAYAREELMAWCKDNDVDYVIGLARNSRLVERIGWELADAAAEAERKGRPARRFVEFPYATLTSWSCQRRVVAKAEHLPGKANPRFVVTSNQLRLLFSAFAPILFDAIRQALHGTQLARATAGTLRLKLLKIGARVMVSARRVKVAPWTPHTLPPQRSHGSTLDYRGRLRPLPTTFFTTLVGPVHPSTTEGPFSQVGLFPCRSENAPRGLLPPTPTPLATPTAASTLPSGASGLPVREIRAS